MAQSGQPVPRLFLRGSIYWADLRRDDGRRLRKSTGKADAVEAMREAERFAIELGTSARSQNITLWEVLEDTFESRWKGTRSATIVRRVCDVIQRELGHLPIVDVNYQRLSDYAQALLRDGLKPATVNRRMSCISTALGECMKRGELVQRPSMPRFREDNVKDRYMSKDEETAILEQLDKRALVGSIMGDTDYTYLRHLAIFLLDTGFRFSEAYVFRLDGDQADLRNGDVKNSKGRRVPLTRRAKVSAEYLLASDRHHELRAMSKEKQKWDWCSWRWGVITKAADCPDVTLHILRHTCASRLVQRGVPIYTVSKWLGHSSVRVTERYAKLAPNSLSDALAALEENP